jgi:topoisomerase-4 subunit A
MSKHIAPPPPPEDGGRIVEEPLAEALSRRYLAYALSTIMNRALPDVRDGLKPVHRRLLFSMRQMRLDPTTSAKKCARVVGDVIGRFHPHGDQSVYEALVRLAQDFAQRYPLIDGQGNFGNIDGDNAAAMRYTECRLTLAAQLLLDGIDEDAVDFRPTYDDEDEEPVVLPAAFPNLLANGSAGIAVGMATSIPPHNIGELIEGCLLLLQRPNASAADLAAVIPGPDFPTGGVIVEPPESLLEAYETGRGGVRVRARWSVERYDRGGWRVVVTEVPYQVQKSRLVEQLALLIETKKAPLLGDVRDESDENVRLVIEPRSRSIEPDVLMESLYRLCDLETRFPVNMNVLDRSGTPRVMGLRPALQAFLDHRRDVDGRRARWRLGKIEARLHILDGLFIVFLNLDEVIRIVRFEDEPKQTLITTFVLSEAQADAILNTRLRQLAKLEEMELRREHDQLTAEQGGLTALLASESGQWAKVADDLRKVRDALGKDVALCRRRSSFAVAPVLEGSAPLEAFMPKEPITVIISERGWIRAAKGKIEDPSELKFKEGDKLGFLAPAETTDKLLIFASDGRFFTLACDKLPSARSQGEPLRLMLDLDDKTEFVSAFPYRPGASRILASSGGYGFVVKEEDLLANRKAGKQVLNVEGDKALICIPADGDQVAVLGDNGKALIFPLEELPHMARAKGVRLQSYREGGLRDLMVFHAAAGAAWTDAAGRIREWPQWREWIGRRASAGRLAPRGFPASRRFRPR